jgi:hypothetical protein
MVTLFFKTFFPECRCPGTRGNHLFLFKKIIFRGNFLSIFLLNRFAAPWELEKKLAVSPI